MPSPFLPKILGGATLFGRGHKNNNFVQQLSNFVNQEISSFGCRFRLLEGTLQNIQNTNTQVREIAQAMSERVDKVEEKMESIRSDQKEEAD